MPFDPYHKWLGIPPSEQPPNHYRLLGISLFESDREVIDSAANRQMAYVQSFGAGEHGAASQKVLNELAAARLCLLDRTSRQVYDARLRRDMPEPEPDRSARPASGDSSGDTRQDARPSRPRDGERDARASRSRDTEHDAEASRRRYWEPVEPSKAPPPEARRPRPRPRAPEVERPDPPTPPPVFVPEPEPDLGGFEFVPLPAKKKNLRGIPLGPLISLSVTALCLFVLAATWWSQPPEAPVEASAAPGPEPAEAEIVEPSEVPATVTSTIEAKAKVEAPAPKDEEEASLELPQVENYPESSFNPLFGGRTIDGPLTDITNCTIEATYSNFALRFEYRLRSRDREPWNGIRLRHGGPRLNLVLCEGKSGGLLYDVPITGLKKPQAEEMIDQIHRVIPRIWNSEKPLGEWNRCEVVCKGPSTTVVINGVVVNHVPNGPEGAGRICLIGYEDVVAFRNIRIFPHDSSPTAPPSNGSDRRSPSIELPDASVSKPVGPDLSYPYAAKSSPAETTLKYPYSSTTPPTKGISTPTPPSRPVILQTRTHDWDGSTSDFGRLDGNVARVGLGGSNDYGFGEVAVETDHANVFKVKIEREGAYRALTDDTMAGFVIDYHTNRGYTNRVALHLDMAFKKRKTTNPWKWGKMTKPDAIYTLKRRDVYDLKLAEWAPAGWDGRVWFTAIIQNTGKDTSMTVTVLERK